ncbi:mediator of DNA damage checkpoint protein 1 [Ixodes scapularis]|uniref:mediator of DNA damage checkpoint protein 1 n=1 Tax=Ixodes scapularis TaxID=6945 RepID=UPI001C3835CE|nr:mediator of DNA damage checkpoint protein 1 [Ixodes scapularis]
MGKATLVPNVQYKLEYEEDISLGGLKAQVLKHLESAATEDNQGSDTCSESLLTAIQIPQDQQLGGIGGTPGDKGTAADSSGSQTSTVPCSNSNDGSQTGLSKARREIGEDGAAGVAAVASTSGPQTDATSEAQSGDDFRLPLMPHIDFTQTESSERADSERSESFQEEGDQGMSSASGCGNKGEDSDAAVTKEPEAFACTPARLCADADGAVGEAGNGDLDGRSAVLQNVPTQDVVVADDVCFDDGCDAFRNAPTQAYASTEVSAKENEDGASSHKKEDAFRDAPTQAYAQMESAVEDDNDDEKDDAFRNAPTQAYAQTESAVEDDDDDDDGKDDAFRNASTQAYVQTESAVEDDDDDGGKYDGFRNAPTQAYAQTESAVEDDRKDDAFRSAPTQAYAQMESAVEGDEDDRKDDAIRNAPTQAYVQTESAVEDDEDDGKDDDFRNAPTQAYAQTESAVKGDEDDGRDDAFRNAPTQAYVQSESAVEDSDDNGEDDVSHNAPIQTFPGAQDVVEESDAEDGDRFDEKDYAFRNAETQGYARTEDLVIERDAKDGARSDGKDDSSLNAATRAYKEGTSHESADDEPCSPDGETRIRVRDSETNGAMPIFTKNDEGKDAEEPSTAVAPRLGPSTNLSRLLFADTEPACDSFVLCAASQSDGDQTDDEEDFCAPTQMDAGSATPKVHPVDLKRSTPVSVNETPPLSPKSAIEETPPSSPSIVPESDPEDADDSMVTARHSLSLLESTGTSLFQDCEEYGDSEVILPVVGRSDKRRALLSSLKRSGGKLVKEHLRTTHREASQLKALEEEPDSVDGNLVGEQRSKQSGAAKKLEYAGSTSSALAIPEEESTPGDVSRCKSASEGAPFSIPGVAPLQLSSLVSLNEETAESNDVVLDSTFTVGGSNATADSSVHSAVAEDHRETAEGAVEEAGFQEADNRLRESSGRTELPNQSVDQTREKHESVLDEEETQVSDVEDVEDTKGVSSGVEAEPAEPLRLSEEADVNGSTLSEVAVKDAESEQEPKVPSLEATEDVLESNLEHENQTEATPLPFKLPKSPGRTKNADSEAADKVSKLTKKGSERKFLSKKTETTKEVTLNLDVVQPPTRSRRSNAGARMKEFLSIEKRTGASGNFREDLASQEANKKEAPPASKEQSNVEGRTSKPKKRGRKSTKEQMDESNEGQKLPSLPQPTEELQLQPLVSAAPESFSAANPAVEGKKTYQPFSRGIWDSQFQSTPYTSGTIDSCLSQAFPTFSQLMVGAGDDCRAADEVDEAAATDMDERKKPPQQKAIASNVSMVVADLDPKEVHPKTIGSTLGFSGKMSEASSRSDTGPDRSKNSLDAAVVQVMDAKAGHSMQRTMSQDLKREGPQDLAVSEPLLEDAGCVPDSDETQDLDALIPAESTRPKWATRKSTPFVPSGLANKPNRKIKLESAEDTGGSGDEFQDDSQTKKVSGAKQVVAASRPSRNAVKPAPLATTSTVQDKQPCTPTKEALPARRRTRKQVLDVLASESNDLSAVREAGEKELGDAIDDKKKSSRRLQSKRAASGDVEGPQSSLASHEVPQGKRRKNKAVSEVPDVTIPEPNVAGSATKEVEDQKGTIRGKEGRLSSSLPGGIVLQVKEAASSESRDSQPTRSCQGRARARKVVDTPVSDVVKNNSEGFNEASAVDKDKREPRSARLKGRTVPEAASRGPQGSQSSPSSQGQKRTQKAANAFFLDVADAGREESDEASAVDEKRDPCSSLSKETTAPPVEQAPSGEFRDSQSSQSNRGKRKTGKEIRDTRALDSDATDAGTEESQEASTAEKNERHSCSSRSKRTVPQHPLNQLQGSQLSQVTRRKQKEAPLPSHSEEPGEKQANARGRKKGLEKRLDSCEPTALFTDCNPRVVMVPMEEVVGFGYLSQSKQTARETPAAPVEGLLTKKAVEEASTTRGRRIKEVESAELPKPVLGGKRRKVALVDVEKKPSSNNEEAEGVEGVAPPPKLRPGRPARNAAVKVEAASQEPSTSRGRKREGLAQDPSPPARKKGRGGRAAATNVSSPKADVGVAPASKGRRSSSLKPRVMFTGLADTTGEEIVKSLGGLVAASPSMCTHLVTDKFRRTVKALSCIAKGIPILSMAWLDSCRASGSFIDHMPFLLKDKAAEKTMKFNLEATLGRAASEGGILNGWGLHATPGVLPPPQDMKEIVSCAGGKYLAKMPTRYADKIVIVSCEEDRRTLAQAKKSSIPVVTAEFVLSGLLRYQLDVKKHTLT